MTQEDVVVLWKDANGWDVRGYKNTLEDLERFANLVAAKEREACAKIVEDSPSYDWHKFACEAAAAIRARGQA
jgi:hypothetical protein